MGNSLSIREWMAKKPGVYKFELYKWKEDGPKETDKGHRVPKPRSGHRIVFHCGSFYSFGGYNPNINLDDEDLQDDPNWPYTRPLFQELWSYNLSSKKWKKLQMPEGDPPMEIPQQLASHSLIMYKGQMVLYGGTGSPFGLATSNDVFKLCMKTRCWEKFRTEQINEPVEEDMPNFETRHIPNPTYGQAVLLKDNFLYCIGGTSGFQYFMDVHRLNLDTLQWKCLFKTSETNDEPKARYRHELCMHKDRIFVLGGGTSFESYGFETISVFSMVANTWEIVPTKPDESIPLRESLTEQYPQPRRCHAAVQSDKYAFIFGGHDGNEIFKDTWRLDLETLEWKEMPFNLPTPVYFHAGGMAPSGKVYSFGGVSHIDNNTRINTVYSSWFKIPTLRDMCWEAVNHYYPSLDVYNARTLLAEGIPKDLIEELHGNPDDAG